MSHLFTTPPTPARTAVLLAAASAGLLSCPVSAAAIYDDTASDLATTGSTPLSISVFDGVNGAMGSGDSRDDLTVIGLLGGSTFQITSSWSAIATDGAFALHFLDSTGTALPGIPSLIPGTETGTDTRSFVVPVDGQVRLATTMSGFEFGSLAYTLNYSSSSVPEPGSAVTAAAALAALMARRRRTSQP